MNTPAFRSILVFASAYILCGTFALAALPSLTQDIAAAKFIAAKFDPFGSYAILDTVPPEFDDFDSFQIDLVEPPRRGRNLKLAGFLSSRQGQLILQLKTISLTLEELSFITQAEQGVHYCFEGRFLKKGVLTRFSTKVPVLEGKLSKFMQGQKVAEKKIRFFTFAPH